MLIIQFEEILSQPDPSTDLCKAVDPRLGDNYPLDSVRKVKQILLNSSYVLTSRY